MTSGSPFSLVCWRRKNWHGRLAPRLDPPPHKKTWVARELWCTTKKPTTFCCKEARGDSRNEREVDHRNLQYPGLWRGHQKSRSSCTFPSSWGGGGGGEKILKCGRKVKSVGEGLRKQENKLYGQTLPTQKMKGKGLKNGKKKC